MKPAQAGRICNIDNGKSNGHFDVQYRGADEASPMTGGRATALPDRPE